MRARTRTPSRSARTSGWAMRQPSGAPSSRSKRLGGALSGSRAVSVMAVSETVRVSVVTGRSAGHRASRAARIGATSRGPCSAGCAPGAVQRAELGGEPGGGGQRARRGREHPGVDRRRGVGARAGLEVVDRGPPGLAGEDQRRTGEHGRGADPHEPAPGPPDLDGLEPAVQEVDLPRIGRVAQEPGDRRRAEGEHALGGELGDPVGVHAAGEDAAAVHRQVGRLDPLDRHGEDRLEQVAQLVGVSGGASRGPRV